MIKNKKCEKVNHSLITKYKVFTNKKHEWEREREIERAVAVEREREQFLNWQELLFYMSFIWNHWMSSLIPFCKNDIW